MMRRLLRLLKAVAALALLIGLLYACVYLLEGRGYFEQRIASEFGRYVGGLIDVESATLSLLDRRLEARGLTHRVKAGDEASIEVPEIDFLLPLRWPDGGPYTPDRISVREPFMRLKESADGVLSPIDLFKPWVPTEFVPAVLISDGTLILTGTGPLNQFLDRLLRSSAVAERRAESVTIATFPEQLPSPDVFGLDGTLQLPGISQVSIHGGLGRDNSFRLRAEVADLNLVGGRLAEALDPRLASRISEYLVRGRANVEFTFATPPSDERGAESGEMHARLKLTGLDFGLPHFDTLFEGAWGAASFDGRSLFLHELWVPDGPEVVDRYRVDGVLDDLFEDSAWRLTLRADNVRSDGIVNGALVWPEIRQAIDDYAPQGTVRFFAEVSRRVGEDPFVRWRVDSKQVSGSFVYHRDPDDPPDEGVGFPYRLEQLHGTVSGAGNRIEIRGVTGIHNGGQLAHVGGWVEIRSESNAYEINVAADQVPVDATLKQALESAAPGSGALVDRFRPEGLVDVEVTAWRAGGADPSHVRGTVRTKGSRLLFEDVPIPLEQVTGTLEFEDDLYRLIDVNGQHGSAQVSVNGTIDGSVDPPALNLIVSARDVPVDDLAVWEALGRLLPDAATSEAGFGGAGMVSMLAPKGTVDLEVELIREPGGDLRFRALLFPRGIDILPDWFPIPIKGVVGQVVLGDLHDNDPLDRRFYVSIDRLEGNYRGARLQAFGRYGDGIKRSLYLRGDHVRLSKEMLDEVGGAIQSRAEKKGLELASLLEHFGASGALSFHYRLGEAADLAAGRPDLRGGLLDLILEGIDARSAVLPGDFIQDLRGRVRIDFAGDQAEIRGLRGDLAAGLGSLHSDLVYVAMIPEGVQLNGDVDFGRLPFGPRLALLLPAALARFFHSHADTGTLEARLPSFRLKLLWPRDGGGLNLDQFSFRGQVNLDDCAIREPVSLRGINANLGLSGSGNLSEPGSITVQGQLADLAFQVGDFALRNLKAFLTFEDGLVSVSELSGPFLGGQLPPEWNRVQFGTGPNAEISGRVAFENADLKPVLSGLTQVQRDVAGKVSLGFEFKGQAASLASMTGHGDIKIVDGQIWELPVLAALYRASLGLVLGAGGKPTFDNGVIEFSLSQGKLILERFELNAPVASSPVGLMLTGRGVVGPTGVDLRVVPQVIAVNVPILSKAIDLLKRGILNYRIFGPLGNPRVVYWNAAADVMAPNQDVTRLPRLAPRIAPDWSRGF